MGQVKSHPGPSWARKSLCLLVLILPAVLAQSAAEAILVPDDTEVVLRLSEPLSSRTSYAGDIVRFVLDDDLRVAGVLVAQKGDRATGTVLEVNRSGFIGSAGNLSLRINHVSVGDTKLPLRGWRFREGDSKAGLSLGLALVTPLGLLKKGKDTQIPEGTLFRAFVHGNTRIPKAALPQAEEKK